MLSRIFPEHIDNRYRGNKLAIWLFYPIVFLNAAIGLVVIFRADSGVQSADGIPLDTYGAAAAHAVVGVAAFLGLAGLLLSLLYLLALFRYRAMIPLMYVLITLNYLGHKGIALMKPITRNGTASGSYVTTGLFALTVAGLVLSLSGKGYLQGQDSKAG